MSSQSIISLPPQLEMTPRSIPLLEKHRNAINNANRESYTKTDNLPFCQQLSAGVTSINMSAGNETRTFYKLAETTFPIKGNEPFNLRISLQPADLMKLATIEKVNKSYK